MDGGRRLLQSVKEVSEGFSSPSLVYAGAPGPFRFDDKLAGRGPGRLSAAAKPAGGSAGFLKSRAAEVALTLALLAGVGAYGAVTGGEYQAFVSTYGDIPDLAAKSLGFGIKAVTIAGERELGESEILAAAGISPRNSLVFIDVSEIRDRLKRVPLIKEASVAKLYPDRLLIEIEEREPYALWQQNGQVRIIAADGMPIDSMHDARFAGLPFVAGDGANEKLGEYLAILDGLGDLRTRIRAGMLVSQRRWSLKVANGIEILLPEKDPLAAVATLVGLQRDFHVLDKDILSLDLRQAGRVVARLSEEAASARAALLAHKTKPKGGQT
jgi:cell division protein FtsQ